MPGTTKRIRSAPSYYDLWRAIPRTRSPLNGYEVLDLSALWPSEVMPIINSSPDLVDIHSVCVNAAIDSWGPRRGQEWYHEAVHGIARTHCRSDAFVNEIDLRIEKAFEAGDPDAERYYQLMDQLYGEDGCPDYDTPAVRALSDEMNKIYDKFCFPRESPQYWSCIHHCFQMAPFAWHVATTWRPDGRWRIRQGRGHGTVADTRNRLVFDMTMSDMGLEAIQAQFDADTL